MRARHKFWKKYDLANQLKLPYEFNAVCVRVLNEILTLTNAEIVLSSDWRTEWNLQELDNIFKFNKVIKSPIDVTEVCPTSISNYAKNRAHEIDIYVQNHPTIEKFVVIDDLDLKPYVPEGTFIRTIEREGIKQSGIKDKILKIML